MKEASVKLDAVAYCIGVIGLSRLGRDHEAQLFYAEACRSGCLSHWRKEGPTTWIMDLHVPVDVALVAIRTVIEDLVRGDFPPGRRAHCPTDDLVIDAGKGIHCKDRVLKVRPWYGIVI